MDTSPTPPLPFTGERFTPECVREIWLEHWQRYAFAAPFARGRHVLDAACGEGYGSALLAREAASVTGVDLDPATIAHAAARYRAPNLRFVRGDAASGEGLGDARFGLITCFETLEHLEAQDALLAGFMRRLDDDGLLLVSTPDRTQYNAHGGEPNPHHVRELERHEFEALLARHVPAFRLYGQKLLFQGALWALDGADGGTGEGPAAATTMRADGTLAPGLAYPPTYYLAVCAKDPARLAGLPAQALFGDAEETVYRHYDEEVRRHIAAGHLLAAQAEEIAALRAELARLRDPALDGVAPHGAAPREASA